MVFIDFDRAPELAAAEQSLQKAEAEHLGVITDLEAAVSRGDVDSVVRLRTQAEVLSPQRLEQAQLAVLDLRLARARDATDGPKHRLIEAEDQATSTEATLRAAQAALTTAEAAYEQALQRKMSPRRSPRASVKECSNWRRNATPQQHVLQLTATSGCAASPACPSQHQTNRNLRRSHFPTHSSQRW